MSGIFEIFKESDSRSSSTISKEKVNKSHPLAFSKKSAGSTQAGPSKLFAPSFNKEFFVNKPKGLSIRTKSDLNVYLPQTSGTNSLNAKDTLKPKEKSSFLKKSPPLKLFKSPQKRIITNVKRLSPKLSPIRQNVPDEFVFAKPTTTTNVKKTLKYPEPEVLSGDFNINKYMEEEIQLSMEQDLLWVRSVRKKDDSIVSLEDEGFISDYNSFEISSHTMSPPSPNLGEVELPSLSDSDED